MQHTAEGVESAQRYRSCFLVEDTRFPLSVTIHTHSSERALLQIVLALYWSSSKSSVSSAAVFTANRDGNMLHKLSKCFFAIFYTFLAILSIYTRHKYIVAKRITLQARSSKPEIDPFLIRQIFNISRNIKNESYKSHTYFISLTGSSE